MLTEGQFTLRFALSLTRLALLVGPAALDSAGGAAHNFASASVGGVEERLVAVAASAAQAKRVKPRLPPHSTSTCTTLQRCHSPVAVGTAVRGLVAVRLAVGSGAAARIRGWTASPPVCQNGKHHPTTASTHQHTRVTETYRQRQRREPEQRGTWRLCGTSTSNGTNHPRWQV